MGYLRYLLYAALQLGLIGGAFWLYSAIRGVSLFSANFLSTGFLALVAFSLLPFIDMIRRQRRLDLMKIGGIRSRPFRLRSDFRASVRGSVRAVKETLRRVCDAAVFADRVLVLTEETEDSLEYDTEPRLQPIGARSKKRRYEPTFVEIHVTPAEEPGMVDLEISSQNDRRDFGFDNIANEENVAIIVLGLNRAGLLRVESTRHDRGS